MRAGRNGALSLCNATASLVVGRNKVCNSISFIPSLHIFGRNSRHTRYSEKAGRRLPARTSVLGIGRHNSTDTLLGTIDSTRCHKQHIVCGILRSAIRCTHNTDPILLRYLCRRLSHTRRSEDQLADVRGYAFHACSFFNNSFIIFPLLLYA